MILYLYLAISFLLGAIAATVFAIWSLKWCVDKADLCSDDKRMINDVLGLPND